MRAPVAILVVMPFLPCAAAAQATQFFATSPAAMSWSYTSRADLGDFDHDGAPDLCVDGWIGFAFRLLHNDGLGDLSIGVQPTIAVNGAPTCAFVDFDGDGDRDLFLSWPGPQGSNVALFRYTSGAWIDASASLPLMQAFNDVVVADLDGDGDEDIAGSGLSIGSGAAGILTNTGGVFTYTSAFGGQQITIAAGDIDGDGDLDIATTTPLQLWRNDGGMLFTNVSAAQLPPLPAYWAWLAFADVDGDGDQDLVLGDQINYVNQFDRLLRNNGSGTFAEVPGAIPPHPGIHTSSLAFADVDEDGDLDLIRGGQPLANLSLNDGTGAFTLAVGRLPPLPNGFARAYAADLDRDGDSDIVLITTGLPGQILWNRHRHLSVPAPPVIGQNWTVELWAQPGYGAGTRAAFLGIGLARMSQPAAVPPLGALWLDLTAPVLLQQALITAATGVAPLSFAIPAVPQFVGITLHAQALIEEIAGTGDVRLTSLVSSTIQ